MLGAINYNKNIILIISNYLNIKYVKKIYNAFFSTYIMDQ